MTAAFALRATDGLILVTDGRTKHRELASDVVPGASVTDKATKITPAPYGLPFAIAVAGRASVNDVPTNELVTEVLADLPDFELRAMDFPAVLSVVREGLAERANRSDSAREARGEAVNRQQTFHLLLAGATSAGDLEVWKSRGRGFDDNELSSENLTMCGILMAWPKELESLATDAGRTMEELVADCFYDLYAALDLDDINHPASYPLSSLGVADGVEEADRLLTAATSRASNVWEWAGVGGR